MGDLLIRLFASQRPFDCTLGFRKSHMPRGPRSMHRLYLLEGIDLRNEAGTADVGRAMTQSKAVAVIAYLALSPLDWFQRRDRIVGLLWPELDQERARAALRKALQLLRG